MSKSNCHKPSQSSQVITQVPQTMPHRPWAPRWAFPHPLEPTPHRTWTAHPQRLHRGRLSFNRPQAWGRPHSNARSSTPCSCCRWETPNLDWRLRSEARRILCKPRSRYSTSHRGCGNAKDKCCKRLRKRHWARQSHSRGDDKDWFQDYSRRGECQRGSYNARIHRLDWGRGEREVWIFVYPTQ